MKKTIAIFLSTLFLSTHLLANDRAAGIDPANRILLSLLGMAMVSTLLYHVPINKNTKAALGISTGFITIGTAFQAPGAAKLGLESLVDTGSLVLAHSEPVKSVMGSIPWGIGQQLVDAGMLGVGLVSMAIRRLFMSGVATKIESAATILTR